MRPAASSLPLPARLAIAESAERRARREAARGVRVTRAAALRGRHAVALAALEEQARDVRELGGRR